MIRVLILRAAGTNCDLETQHAWELAGASAERVHIRRAAEFPSLLREAQVLTIPGGFSYGDDISAGAIFAAQIRRHLADEVRGFVDAGKLVLGICNGFQILVKAGLLPGGDDEARSCTVAHNDPPGFQDRWVAMRAPRTPCVFVEEGRTYEMPMAHGEGRLAFSDPTTLKRIQSAGMDALCYVSADAASGFGGEPANPNGSAGDMAGMCDATGRIFGLMPHPERFVHWTQHPCWTSLPPREVGDGLHIFRRAVAYFR